MLDLELYRGRAECNRRLRYTLDLIEEIERLRAELAKLRPRGCHDVERFYRDEEDDGQTLESHTVTSPRANPEPVYVHTECPDCARLRAELETAREVTLTAHRVAFQLVADLDAERKKVQLYKEAFDADEAILGSGWVHSVESLGFVHGFEMSEADRKLVDRRLEARAALEATK